MNRLNKKQMNKLRNKFNHDISDDYIERATDKYRNSKQFKDFQREILYLL